MAGPKDEIDAPTGLGKYSKAWQKHAAEHVQWPTLTDGKDRKMTTQTETAILAGGCFWGMQDLLRRQPGVLSTRVGYTGGDVPNATYRDHGTHAEALEIVFDPRQISFRQILEFFFQIHDPTTKNRQGNDIGSSYRSAIFYLDDEQKQRGRETPWPTSTLPVSGPARSSPRSFPRARSGRPSRNIRTIWNTIPTATPAISFGRTGSCPHAGNGPSRGRYSICRAGISVRA